MFEEKVKDMLVVTGCSAASSSASEKWKFLQCHWTEKKLISEWVSWVHDILEADLSLNSQRYISIPYAS